MGNPLSIGLLVLVGLAPGSARAGPILGGHHHFGHHRGGNSPGGLGAVGSGYGGIGWGLPYYGVPLGVAGYGYGFGAGFAPGGGGFPPMLAAPTPIAPAVTPRTARPTSTRTKRPDPAFAAELMTLGDRLFRAGNFKKAVERFEQAIKADPGKAAPRIRLAQVALVRGDYHEAAEQIREADTVEPSYLLNAADIRALYLEPGDFSRPVARLESHLQSHPEDRDAWLVLGAEHYLSGRTREAADVFLRLTDRRADPTLSAFLSATKARDDR